MVRIQISIKNIILSLINHFVKYLMIIYLFIDGFRKKRRRFTPLPHGFPSQGDQELKDQEKSSFTNTVRFLIM